MKLLIVSHTYTISFNQRKWIEMKQISQEIVLRIITPRSVKHTFGRYTREIAPELTKEEVVDINDIFFKSHMTYFLDPLRFAKILRDFQPDRIHIEEDPYSAIGVETVFLARHFCPEAKISFFIWDNLAREPHFPFDLIKWRLNRYSLSRADLVICGNREGQTLLHNKKGYKGRSAVLPQLGLCAADYQGGKNDLLREQLNINKDIPLIGYVGRLIPEKGIAHLMEALCRIQKIPWRLLILGSGPLEEAICKNWLPIFGDRLIYRKAVPHAEVPDYMRALDILVLPSYTTETWKEQFGLVLAQAMLAAVPCIGSSSGAIPDVIGPGGIVFQEKNIDELTTALVQLLTDSELRSSFGEAARSFALKHYSHRAIANAYLALF